MLRFFVLAFLISTGSCTFAQDEQHFDNLIQDLELCNILLLEDQVISEHDYFNYFKIDMAEHERRKKAYYNAIAKILSQDKEILEYFLTFNEKLSDDLIIIYPINPIVGYGYENAIFTREAGLYLIDFYLRAEYKRPIKPIYANELNYEELSLFIKMHKKTPLKYMRNEYKIWLRRKLKL